MRFVLRLSLLAALLIHPAGAAGLYEATTIVSGMDGRSRPEGLVRILREVLFKASGNPAWLTDPRPAEIATDDALEAVMYLDRFTNMPKHDEQGSRDRPYDLTARFDAATIDGLLQGWGDAPWPMPRPVVAIMVTIAPRGGPPVPMRADTDTDERHRGALLAAAERAGLAVVIPATFNGQRTPSRAVTLRGQVSWSDRDFGWNSEWEILGGQRTVSWSQHGESFDAAYRTGLFGAAAALSGHDPLALNH